MLSQEVGENVNIQSILNNQTNWKGRAQQIMMLQKKASHPDHDYTLFLVILYMLWSNAFVLKVVQISLPGINGNFINYLNFISKMIMENMRKYSMYIEAWSWR